MIGLYQVYLQIGSMTQSAQSLVSSVQQSIMPISSDAKLAAEKTGTTQTQIDRLSQQIENLSRELASLKKGRGSRVQ
jgi:peptidoglycan hydrolase CwlO-like protein